MEDTPAPSEAAVPASRPRRAWWQWVLGLALIGFAVSSLVVRWIERVHPQWLRTNFTVEPLELRLQPGTVDGDVVPAGFGEYAGCNFLMITLDTTRADRLGCYGNPDIKTPTIDRLAREGILFSRACSVAPTTLPSHSSMMTSLYPYHHGARRNGSTYLTPEHLTLAEFLSKEGYATGAAVSAFVLNSCFGIAQGFSHFDDEVTFFPDAPVHREAERRGDETTDHALAWLDQHADGPFFFWLHLYDAHSPYQPPEPFATQYDTNPYDGEIAFVDTQLARVLKWLDDKRLGDKTIVAVLGDHGESLGEHRESSHGMLIYDATIRVPFILRCGSRLGHGLHIAHPVSTVDLMPTVLAMLGLSAPASCEGIDLAKKPSPDRLIYGETLEGFYQHGLAPLLSVRDAKCKYIYGPAPEIYDLVNDPNELHDLSAQQTILAAEMKQKLERGFDHDLEKAAFAAATQELSADDLEKLSALGYAGGGFTAPPSHGALPDPKQVMDLLEEIRMTVSVESIDERPEAIAHLEELAEEHPDFFPIFKTLADLYIREKDYYSAQRAYKRCLEIYPDLPFIMQSLAAVYALTGDFPEAIKEYQAALNVSPTLRTAWGELGVLLLHVGRNEQALEHLQQAIKYQPDNLFVGESLVAAAIQARQSDQTIEMLLQLMRESSERDIGIRFALAQLLAQNGKVPQALVIMRNGMQSAPNDTDLAAAYGALVFEHASQQRVIDEAVAMVESLCEKTKNENVRYLRILAAGYAKRGQFEKALATAQRARDLALKDSRMDAVERLDERIAEYRKAAG